MLISVLLADLLKLLLKEFTSSHTVSSIAETLKISRVGTWKALKTLEKDGLIRLDKISSKKTATFTANLNWENPLTEKALALILAKEASDHKKWVATFNSLEKKHDFLLLYGSILHSPKKARDVDVLLITKDFRGARKSFEKIQVTQLNKVHALILAEEELQQEIKSNNKAIIDALRRGVVLFGQESFVKLIKSMER